MVKKCQWGRESMKIEPKWKLLIRPYPFKDETLLSYLFRISELNCIPLDILIKPFLFGRTFRYDKQIALDVLNDHLNLNLSEEVIDHLCGEYLLKLMPHAQYNNISARPPERWFETLKCCHYRFKSSCIRSS